jgi:hypothetical protein
MKKIIFLTTSFLCLLLIINSSIIILADSKNTIYSNDYTYDPPVIQLLYPNGGEKLNETIKIRWVAFHSDSTYEDIKITIYYKIKESDNWIEIVDSLPNTGEYNWSTNNLLDGIYFIRILAIDGDNNIGIATSDDFTLFNNNIKLEISEIKIYNKKTDEINLIKNCDNITISATINGLGSDKISKYNISADLTDLNLGNNIHPDTYDGKNATWRLFYVKCIDYKDNILLKINIDNHVEKNCTINIDNECPKLILKKPLNGIYIHNRKLFIPISKTIIFGKIDIELEAYDNYEIHKLELYIDGKLEYILYNNYLSFKLKNRLFGRHFLEFRLYDLAGNMVSEKRIISIYNLI